MKKETIVFLVGPTGSGKSEAALLLAERLGGEIVSADSMQVYRGMNIGTAKPGSPERKAVRHHLIDRVSPRSTFSVHRYRTLALRALRDILRRGKIPLVVGGSGLYLRALRKGLSVPTGTDPKLRTRLEGEADREGLGVLYERLKAKNPARARKIHPNDRRRIIRALEIAASARPGERSGGAVPLEDLGFSVRVLGIQRDRRELYERIDRRVEAMFQKGLEAEVRRLARKGFSRTAREALGYREVLAVIARQRSRPGRSNLRTGIASSLLTEGTVKGILISPDASVTKGVRASSASGPPRNDRTQLIQEIQTRTRQFAKRQLTWFRREKEIEWVRWQEGESAAAVADKILSKVRNG